MIRDLKGPLEQHQPYRVRRVTLDLWDHKDRPDLPVPTLRSPDPKVIRVHKALLGRRALIPRFPGLKERQDLKDPLDHKVLLDRRVQTPQLPDPREPLDLKAQQGHRAPKAIRARKGHRGFKETLGLKGRKETPGRKDLREIRVHKVPRGTPGHKALRVHPHQPVVPITPAWVVTGSIAAVQAGKS